MKYPECARLDRSRLEYLAIIDFIYWLSENSMQIGKYEGEQFLPSREAINLLLMKYLKLDEIKLEKERQHMLMEISENETRTAPSAIHPDVP